MLALVRTIVFPTLKIEGQIKKNNHLRIDKNNLLSHTTENQVKQFTLDEYDIVIF